MATDHPVGVNIVKLSTKQLKLKANEFLNSRRAANNLVDIISHLQQCVEHQLPLTPCLLTLEVIFVELLKRRELCTHVAPASKAKITEAEINYREWLQAQYEESLELMHNGISSPKSNDSIQALVTSMKLLAAEGKYPIEPVEGYSFPKQRLRNVIIKLLADNRSTSHLTERFKEYAEYLDVVVYSWKHLSSWTPKKSAMTEFFSLNYLEFINVIPVTKDLQESRNLLCLVDGTECVESFDYAQTRKTINKVWSCIILWDMKEAVHKKVLIVLLERILPHLDKPILLTDFLMDSLDVGGPIGLLALQGIFTLIQKHNITYPNIYEKLYSMFEPEVFHTKFKARLFYLADIFLSSTHLPEALVAAFTKRLARLSLIAPPQDAHIILIFIGNLILRHPGLKRLICAESAVEFANDPYVENERDPAKSKAIDSSLWEIVLLQKHIVPAVATAAKFISKPLPTQEWDLSEVLETKEEDIFDKEISQKTKQYALAFEKPTNMYLAKNDKVVQYWKLF